MILHFEAYQRRLPSIGLFFGLYPTDESWGRSPEAEAGRKYSNSWQAFKYNNKAQNFPDKDISRLWKFIAVFTFGYCLHLWFLQHDKTKKIKDSHFIVINARFSYKSQVKMVHKNISTTIITENFEDDWEKEGKSNRKSNWKLQCAKCVNPVVEAAFLRILFFICFWASHLHYK